VDIMKLDIIWRVSHGVVVPWGQSCHGGGVPEIGLEELAVRLK